jgi:hypothetical protein
MPLVPAALVDAARMAIQSGRAARAAFDKLPKEW